MAPPFIRVLRDVVPGVLQAFHAGDAGRVRRLHVPADLQDIRRIRFHDGADEQALRSQHPEIIGIEKPIMQFFQHVLPDRNPRSVPDDELVVASGTEHRIPVEELFRDRRGREDAAAVAAAAQAAPLHGLPVMGRRLVRKAVVPLVFLFCHLSRVLYRSCEINHDHPSFQPPYGDGERNLPVPRPHPGSGGGAVTSPPRRLTTSRSGAASSEPG